MIVLVFSLPFAGNAGSRLAFSPAPYFAQEQWLDVAGARICYLDAGQGEAVVLVHGWAGNAWNWMEVFGPLSKNYRVIALDLPGHGKSGCPDRFGFSMIEYADFVVKAMDELGIERATLVGSSMGGAVAAWAAVRHPDRVARLILVDAAGTSIENPLLKIAGALFTPATVIPMIHMVFPVNEKTLAEVPESERKRVILAEELYKSDQRKCASTALAKSMRSLGKQTIDERLPDIKAQTLVIWGSDDPLLPLAAGERYQTLIPGARLAIIPNGNHTPMQWTPDEFLKEVQSFMEAE